MCGMTYCPWHPGRKAWLLPRFTNERMKAQRGAKELTPCLVTWAWKYSSFLWPPIVVLSPWGSSASDSWVVRDRNHSLPPGKPEIYPDLLIVLSHVFCSTNSELLAIHSCFILLNLCSAWNTFSLLFWAWLKPTHPSSFSSGAIFFFFLSFFFF